MSRAIDVTLTFAQWATSEQIDATQRYPYPDRHYHNPARQKQQWRAWSRTTEGVWPREVCPGEIPEGLTERLGGSLSTSTDYARLNHRAI